MAQTVGDRIWFAIDHATPSWDQAEYLTGALNYWRAFQTPQWFSADWWTSLWQLSSKIPPLVYISTAPFLSLFGAGPDQSTLVHLLYSAILLSSVYALGTFLFNVSVGLWAAGLCVIFPGIYRVRLDYLLDYPLAAMVTLSFTCLTIWRGKGNREQGIGNRKQETGENKREQILGGMLSDRLLSLAHRFSPITTRLNSTFKIPFSLSTQGREQNSKLIPHDWLLALFFGLTFGLALMVKQPALLFLLVPLVAAGAETLWKQSWGRLAQLLAALGVSLLVWGPWYRTNWLLILTSGKRATVDSAIAEGDPSLLSLDAWTYYLKLLPLMVSLPLLLVGLAGILLFWRRSRVSSRWLDKADYAPMTRAYRQQIYAVSQRSLSWLLIFCIGGYFFSSLNINKDERYVVPYLPAIAVMLAYGLTLLPNRWRRVKWGAVVLSGILMLCNLFPINLAGVQWLRNPVAYHPVYLGQAYPYSQVVGEVIQTEPYLRSTVGVLPSTAEVNQHNINYYGNLRNFQVYGRQVGTRLKQVPQDGRSLPWFITKTDFQGSIRKQDAHAAIVQLVEQGEDFQIHKTWSLPDGSTLKLFRRRIPLLEVNSIGAAAKESKKPETNPINAQKQTAETQKIQNPKSKVLSSPTPDSPLSHPLLRLDQIIVPEKAPAGKPIPVTYRWSGTWDRLQSGLALLTWRRQEKPAVQGSNRWFHDHGIGMGSLQPALSDPKEYETQASAALQGQTAGEKNLSPSPHLRVSPSSLPSPQYQVTERMAMQPPKNLAAGTYTLEATYLNRKTGETSQIAVPPVSLRIDPTATPSPAPELDWITQLRSLATVLPQGIPGLNLVFDQVGRMNQYDPIQDYITQTRQAMEYRLKQEPKNRDFAYALALADVLKRRVNPAIAAMQKVTQLDPKNPNAYAYFAFVNLYDFRPGAAQTALNRALKLNPKLPELHALRGVAALMQGNLAQAWQYAQTYRQMEKGKDKG